MLYACSGVTCHLHFWQNDLDFLRATVAKRGGTDTKWESAQKVNSGEEKFLHWSCPDSNSQPFNHKTGALPTSNPGSMEIYFVSDWYLVQGTSITVEQQLHASFDQIHSLLLLHLLVLLHCIPQDGLKHAKYRWTLLECYGYSNKSASWSGHGSQKESPHSPELC